MSLTQAVFFFEYSVSRGRVAVSYKRYVTRLNAFVETLDLCCVSLLQNCKRAIIAWDAGDFQPFNGEIILQVRRSGERLGMLWAR